MTSRFQGMTSKRACISSPLQPRPSRPTSQVTPCSSVIGLLRVTNHPDPDVLDPGDLYGQQDSGLPDLEEPNVRPLIRESLDSSHPDHNPIGDRQSLRHVRDAHDSEAREVELLEVV